MSDLSDAELVLELQGREKDMRPLEQRVLAGLIERFRDDHSLSPVLRDLAEALLDVTDERLDPTAPRVAGRDSGPERRARLN